MEDLLWVAGVMGLAVFLQTAMGFGSALVAMPLLISKLGLMTAAPLVALMTLTTRLVMLSRYRATFRLADVWRLMLSAAVGIPLGLIILVL
jgi:uncharacterized protein